MSLRNYHPPTKTVDLGNGDKLSVRALGFDDLQRIVIEHADIVDQAFKLFTEHVQSPEDMKSFGATFITALPQLAAQVIAIGADEDDLAEVAKRLPAPIQLDCLLAIYSLTFVEPDSLTRFLGNVSGLLSTIPRPNLSASNISSSASGATLNS